MGRFLEEIRVEYLAKTLASHLAGRGTPRMVRAADRHLPQTRDK